MKKWLFLCCVVLLGCLPAVATDLVVSPLQGSAYRRALATIGKVVYDGDSLYLYDHSGAMLYKERLSHVQQLAYSDGDDPATGMTESRTGSKQLRVFPNPTASTLLVEGIFAGGGLLRLYNSQGQLVKTTTAVAERTTLDVSDLPAGTYLLLCEGDAFKIIKE